MTDLSLLDAALSYAACGWYVFPCHTPTGAGCSCRRACGRIGKHPRTRNGLKDATTSATTIRQWWKQWPQANIAVATGTVSGLVVLDEDTYKGGDTSRVELERTYQPLPETVQQLTGGGGVQFFFAHPGTHVKNGVEALGVGLDIRGDGGYVIAPPSLHASGRRYAWELSHHPDETPRAPLPAWLLALCQDTTRRESVSAGAPIPQGQRNQTLFQLGCAMRARGFSEAALAGALTAINTTQCQPPLDAAEVATIAASCAQYPAGPPREDTHQRTSAVPGKDGAQTPANGTRPPETRPLAAVSDDGPLPYSDYTNALALVRQHGQELRYCHPWGKWLTWRGTHWQQDTTGAVMRSAKQTIKRLARQVEDLDDNAAVKALLAHVKASLATLKLKAMVESAQSEPSIPVLPGDLDTNPWLLNCANGTLDLQTGTLRPHDRADLLTRCLAVAFNPQAPCPTWERFLWRIMGGTVEPDSEDDSTLLLEQRQQADERAKALIGFLQRAIGYSLTGDTREQCLLIFWGSGANGKSTLINTLLTLLGPYAMKATAELLIVSKNDRHPTERADLFGKRFVAAIETEEGGRLNEVFVKEATGGDPLRARRMREDFWQFDPAHKVFLATNHKPVIRGTDHAIWRRIKLVPFTVAIPDADQDKQLPAKLYGELPGILAWAVRGCLTWQQDGLGTPDAVLEATAGYRQEMDVLGAFLAECCVIRDYASVKASALYVVYKEWCEATGEHALIQRNFGMRLSERGLERYKNNGSWWRGVALPSEPTDRTEPTERKNGIHS